MYYKVVESYKTQPYKTHRSSLSAFFQNLTEFNTAHNKRISLLTIEEGNLEIQRPKRKRRNSRVTFNEEDSIINPGSNQSPKKAQQNKQKNKTYL